MLKHYLGMDNPNGPFYLLYSGFGPFAIAALGTLGWFFAMWHVIRKHNCHAPRCWRVGRITRDGRVHCLKHGEVP